MDRLTLDRYSAAYASNQFRALQRFFKWLADEEEIPDPMAGLKPPRVPDKPVPVFTGEELQRLEHACAGRSCSPLTPPGRNRADACSPGCQDSLDNRAPTRPIELRPLPLNC